MKSAKTMTSGEQDRLSGNIYEIAGVRVPAETEPI